MNHLIVEMTTSISEVMETMFYIPVEPQEISAIKECGFLDADEIEACRITFSGTFSGKMYLLVPEQLLSIMTENFTGEQLHQLTEEHRIGTIKEALNMIAGNTFSKIAPNTSFGLDVPEIDKRFIDELCNNGKIILVNTMDGEMAVGVHIT
ncbi:chemotaxis protein CheX [Desulfamplus magnetovallimortis]|nr:chemotaxis protein CheX [Desulfamplus magnetovallimortis]